MVVVRAMAHARLHRESPAACAQDVVQVRHQEQTYPTEFGHISVQAGHIEKPAAGEHRFVAKPQVATSHPFIKEE